MLTFLSFRLLTTEEELGCFISRSCALVGNQIPLPYLQAGRVVGVFLGSEMVGGWAFSYPSNGSLRCLDGVPHHDHVRKELDALKSAGKLCEITQMWLDPRKVNSRQSVRFLQKMADDILLNCTPHIIFGFATQHSGLGRFYSRLNPRVLYSGPLNRNTDIKTHSEATVMLLSRSNLRFVLWRNFGEILIRIIGKKRGQGIKSKGGRAVETGKLEPIAR